MRKKSFICTSYREYLCVKWNVKNGMRQGGISYWVIFNFYLNEVISDIFKLPAGCTLKCSKVNTLGYADDYVLVASTAQQLKCFLNAFASKRDVKNISVPYHKAIECLYARNFNNNKHEYLEKIKFPIFTHFLTEKQIQFTFRQFKLRSPCLSDHKY